MSAADEMTPRAQRGFWSRVDKTAPDGCWQWLGSTSDTGYGRLTYARADGRSLAARAHRISYELARRPPVPEGMQLDHLCRNRLCVNPAHLEVVTPRQNSHRTPRFVGGHVERRTNGWRAVWREPDPVTGENKKRTASFLSEAEARAFVDARRESALAEAS